MPITIDFETYYDDDYSLRTRGMTYEKYVRDPRFEVICCAFHDHDKEKPWVVFGQEEVRAELQRLQLNNQVVVAHNMMFDGFILSDFYGIEAGGYSCTMEMARVYNNGNGSVSLANLSRQWGLPDKGTAVHDMKGLRLKDMTQQQIIEYGEYCVGDVKNSSSLFKLMRGFFSVQDMNLISETLRWAVCCKFELDIPLLEEYRERLRINREMLLNRLTEKYHTDTDGLRAMLRSPPRFAQMLEELGVEPPTKLNSKGLVTYAFAKDDIGFKELLEHHNPEVVDLVEIKMGVTSSVAETRAESFLGIASRGKFPFPLRPFGAHTGRHTATGGINCQNLPKRVGDKSLRKSMRAPAGFAVVTCDLSQIEVRKLTATAGQMNMVQAFLDGEDPYGLFGTELFGYPVNKSTVRERNIAKEAVLSLGYLAGWKTYQLRLKGNYGIEVSDAEAKRTVNFYRNSNVNVREFWSDCDRAIAVMHQGGEYKFGVGGEYTAVKGMIVLADGWKIRYDDIQIDTVDAFNRPQYSYYSHEQRSRKKIYSGLLANNLTQGSAARIFHWHLLQLRRAGLLMVGAVHDELIGICPLSEIFHWHDTMTRIMRSTPDWAKHVPVDCEFDIGWNYADQMSIKDFVKENYDTVSRYISKEYIDSRLAD